MTCGRDISVLECLVDGTEPTTLVVDMLAEDADAPAADAVACRLGELERRGWVVHTVEPHPFRPAEDERWWRLTDAGWMALVDSGTLPPDAGADLSGDRPPLRRAIAHLLDERPRTVDELVDAVLAGAGTLPPDRDLQWPQLAADRRRTLAQLRFGVLEQVQRAAGRLAFDRLAAVDRDASPARWTLTERGRDLVRRDR